ncbi:MAG: TMEM165/GDT1 family protein [Gammaproteobacteria bacterium]|nr:TMEM165/GDT1 family protein [Gammaproteobacteria bacterium]
MEALLLSTFAVFIAEIGDRTQLLALVLATRFRRPWPIVAGIIVATLANHFAAAWAGQFAADLLDPELLRWVLGIGFLLMAGWLLIPDSEDEEAGLRYRFGPFLTTTVAFFLVEIGDKTQVATVALGARFESLAFVVIGTTLGMLLANIPVVVAGKLFADRIPMRWVHGIAAAIFALMGLWLLFNGL